MFRTLVVVSLLFAVPRPTADDAKRNNLSHFVDHKFEAALRVSDVVKIRFMLAAAATGCRHVDNLFGYNLLLAQFTDTQKALIDTAARDGWDRGSHALAFTGGDPSACAATLRSLHTADDELVVLAEQVAHEGERPLP